MRDIRLCASQFKSSFKRLNEALEEHEIEAKIEKDNPFPEAPDHVRNLKEFRL